MTPRYLVLTLCLLSFAQPSSAALHLEWAGGMRDLTLSSTGVCSLHVASTDSLTPLPELSYVVWVAESDSLSPIIVRPRLVDDGDLSYNIQLGAPTLAAPTVTDTLTYLASAGPRRTQVWWRMTIAGGVRARIRVFIPSLAETNDDSLAEVTVNGGTTKPFAPVPISAIVSDQPTGPQVDLQGLCLRQLQSLTLESGMPQGTVPLTPTTRSDSHIIATGQGALDSLTASAQLHLAWDGGATAIVPSEAEQAPSTYAPAQVLIQFRSGAVAAIRSQVSPLGSFTFQHIELQDGLAAAGVVAMSRVVPSFSPADTLGRTPTGRPVHLEDLSGIYLAELADTAGVEAAIAEIAAWPDVVSASPNYLIHFASYPTNDPGSNEQWGLENALSSLCAHADGTGGLPSLSAASINVAPAWQRTMGDPSVQVGIIDSGVQNGHLDFVANGSPRIIYYTASPDFTVYDEIGHGTQVAGIVAATADNSVGIAGVAPGCTPVSIKLGATATSVINAINLARDLHLPIINLSIGFSGSPAGLEAACENAYLTGTFIVASAGNVEYDKYYGQWAWFDDYPARYRNRVCAVGAMLPDMTVWNDCHINPSLCYPGNPAPAPWRSNEDFASQYSYRWLDVVAPGGAFITTDLLSSTSSSDYWDISQCHSLAYPFQGFGGTSAAAPFVAGTAALLKSLQPRLSPAGLDTLLKATAVALDAPHWRGDYGYGLIQAGAAAALLASSDLVLRYEEQLTIVDSTYVPVMPGGYAAWRYHLRVHVPWFGTRPHVPVLELQPLAWINPAGTNAASEDGLDTHFAWISSSTNEEAIVEAYVYRELYFGGQGFVRWYPAAPNEAHVLLEALVPSGALVSVAEQGLERPLSLEVLNNPSVAGARLIAEAGAAGHLSVALYDIGGRRVRAFEKDASVGRHEFELSGGDGPRLRPGVYFVRGYLNGQSVVRRFVLLRSAG